MSRALLYRRITELAILAAFFGGLASLIHETPWLENAFDLGVSIFTSLLITAALIFLVYRLQLLRHVRHIELWEAWGLLAVGISLIATAGVTFTNRVRAVPLPPEEWVVSEKTHLPPRPKVQERWELRLTNSNESHWIYVTSAEWNSITRGQTYQPKLLIGQLKLRFVYPPLP
jgi:hypothetical protein